MLLLYACELATWSYDIIFLIKYQKEREKRRREWELFNWGRGSKGKERELAGWNESDNANQTALTTTNSVTQKTKIQSHNTQWVTTEPLQYSVQTDICSKWSMQWKPWDAEVLRLESRERIVWFSRLRGGRLPSEFVCVLYCYGLVRYCCIVLLVVLYCIVR